MATVIGNALLEVGIKDNTKQGLSFIDKNANAVADKLDKKFSSLGTTIAGVFAGTQVIGAIKTLATASLGLAGDLNDMSEALGISVENLSSLKYAGLGAGVEFGKLEKIFVKFSDKLNDAKKGSKEAQAAFNKLGIDFNTASIEDVTDAVLRLGNEYYKAGKQQEFLGIALELVGGKQANILARLASSTSGLTQAQKDAAAAGALMSSTTSRALDEIGDKWEALKMSMQVSFAEGLIKGFGGGNKTSEDIQKNLSIITEGIAILIGKTANLAVESKKVSWGDWIDKTSKFGFALLFASKKASETSEKVGQVSKIADDTIKILSEAAQKLEYGASEKSVLSPAFWAKLNKAAGDTSVTNAIRELIREGGKADEVLKATITTIGTIKGGAITAVIKDTSFIVRLFADVGSKLGIIGKFLGKIAWPLALAIGVWDFFKALQKTESILWSVWIATMRWFELFDFLPFVDFKGKMDELEKKLQNQKYFADLAAKGYKGLAENLEDYTDLLPPVSTGLKGMVEQEGQYLESQKRINNQTTKTKTLTEEEIKLLEEKKKKLAELNAMLKPYLKGFQDWQDFQLKDANPNLEERDKRRFESLQKSLEENGPINIPINLDLPKTEEKIKSELPTFALKLEKWFNESLTPMIENIKSWVNPMGDTISNILDMFSASYEAKIISIEGRLDSLRTKWEDEKSKLEELGLQNTDYAKEREAEFKREEKRLQEQAKAQWKRSQNMQVAMAQIQAIQGSLNAFTSTLTAPWPLNMILAPINSAIALAAGMANVAKIKATPAPKFASGGIVKGSPYRDGTPVLAMGGEAFINRQATEANRNAIDFINRGGKIGQNGGVTIQINGDVIGTQDFVEKNLIPAFDKAYKRNVQMAFAR